MLVNHEKFEEFLKTNGKRAAKILSSLGKHQKFVDALSIDLGQELMIDLLTTTEELLDKIIDEKATSEEKAEYRVCKKIYTKWLNRLSEYKKLVDKINS